MNFSEKLVMILEHAKSITLVLEQLGGGANAAAMKHASDIFELVDSILTSKDMEAHYGLRVEGRQPDGDGVSGSRKVSGTVRYPTGAERGQQRGAHRALEHSQQARARTRKARKRPRNRKKVG